MRSINLNEYVYIIPKEQDFIDMKKHDDEILPSNLQYPLDYYKKRVNEKGFLQFQIHSFMEYFGGLCLVGNSLPGKDGVIYFEENDLKTVE